ncbi:gliding motility lipoprotein GldH [Halocola ammonii]
MKTNFFLSILFLATILIGCKPEGQVYADHKELSPDVEWLKEDKREFNVPVEDNSALYNLSLSFRYATGYQFQVVRVKVTETSPSGDESVNEYELKVRDENGEYIGDPGLDIWDSEHLVETDKKFDETGTYTYVVEHIMPVDPLHYAMEIGLIVDKVD